MELNGLEIVCLLLASFSEERQAERKQASKQTRKEGRKKERLVSRLSLPVPCLIKERKADRTKGRKEERKTVDA